MYERRQTVEQRRSHRKSRVAVRRELLREPAAYQLEDVVHARDFQIRRVGTDRVQRRAFSRFGVKPTQHRNAAEALLRRLAKHGDIPSVNTLVDIGNLISIRHAMPVAAFDLAGIGSITVRFATGDERFTDLGSSDGVFPDPGEVIFVDDDDVVSARRWCWRQSAQSATSQATVEALIVVEGHHDTAAQDVEAALGDLASLLAAHQPNSLARSYVLSPANPRTGTREGAEGP